MPVTVIDNNRSEAARSSTGGLFGSLSYPELAVGATTLASARSALRAPNSSLTGPKRVLGCVPADRVTAGKAANHIPKIAKYQG